MTKEQIQPSMTYNKIHLKCLGKPNENTSYLQYVKYKNVLN